MFTKDERNLEKYIDQHFYISDLSPEKWEFYYNETIKQVFLTYEPFEEDLKYYEENKREIEKFLKDILLTPRQIKSFGRHLKRKLSTEAGRTVNFADVVCLISIEATNPRLYFWLMNNKDLLITNINQNNSIKEALESRNNFCKKIKDMQSEEKICDIKEIEFICYIFDNSKKKNRSVVEELYFSNYFFRDSIPYILTPFGENKLKGILNKKPNDLDVYNEIDKNIKKSISSNKKDHVYLILNQIKKFILDEEDFDRGYCLLITFGKIIKAYYKNDSQRFYAFIVWDFLSNYKERKEDILIKIFDFDVSDLFTANILFYSMNENRRPNSIVLEDQFVEKVKTKYKEKYGYIGRQGSGKLINVFEISDAPMRVLYRYRDISSNNKETSNYLIKIFVEYPETLKSFSLNFFFESSMDGEFYNGESMRNLSYLLEIDSLIKLKNHENIRELIDNDKSLKDWLNIIDNIHKKFLKD